MATVSRKTEVTKLITVTLGKIQESKHAKCGLNLRKSLLVASVLHKARDIYVTEVKNRVVDHVSSSTTDSSNCSSSNEDSVPAKVRRFTSQRSMSVIEEEETARQQSSREGDDTHNNTAQTHIISQSSLKDNSSMRMSVRPTFCEEETTTSQESSQCEIVDDILDELVSSSEGECRTTDKENSPPTSNELLPASCGRCLKRRASTDYPEGTDVENNNTTKDSIAYRSPSYYVPKKRTRSNSVDNSDAESAAVVVEENNKTCAMDTTQINSLVNIFSQSFPEFTSTEASDLSSAYETSTEMNTFALCRDSIALTA